MNRGSSSAGIQGTLRSRNRAPPQLWAPRYPPLCFRRTPGNRPIKPSVFSKPVGGASHAYNLVGGLAYGVDGRSMHHLHKLGQLAQEARAALARLLPARGPPAHHQRFRKSQPPPTAHAAQNHALWTCQPGQNLEGSAAENTGMKSRASPIIVAAVIMAPQMAPSFLLDRLCAIMASRISSST